MTNYATMAKRIRSADSIEALRKLETSLDRLYNNGVLSVSEFQRLDLMVMDRMVTFDLARTI